MKAATGLKISLIAPCGMNCGLCYAFQRKKNRCSGCNLSTPSEREYLSKCAIRNCTRIKNSRSKYCGSCDEFPCRRLKSLDKRYRSKYGMSMLENLSRIQTKGIRNFLREEKTKWKCTGCGNILCIHKEGCLTCSKKRIIKKFEN